MYRPSNGSMPVRPDLQAFPGGRRRAQGPGQRHEIFRWLGAPRLTFAEQTDQIAEHGLSRPASLRLRREANVGRTYNAGLRHRGLQLVSAEPSAGFRHVGDVLKD